MNTDFFLLTYSVENESNKVLSDKVRNFIADIKFNDLPSINEAASKKIIDWEKLGNVETTIRGIIRVSESRHSSFADDAEATIRSLLSSILEMNNVTKFSTEIRCAMQTESSGKPFTFTVMCS